MDAARLLTDTEDLDKLCSGIRGAYGAVGLDGKVKGNLSVILHLKDIPYSIGRPDKIGDVQMIEGKRAVFNPQARNYIFF